jgi:hypothetical protein
VGSRARALALLQAALVLAQARWHQAQARALAGLFPVAVLPVWLALAH